MCYNKLLTVGRGGKVKDQNDEILGFEFVFVG